MKKVLIITYYWPPTGSGGVYRWLKFAKYLPEFGWEPIIYTPLNPEQPEVDASLLKDIPEGITVLKRKIFEPYTLYRLFTGKKKKDSNYNFVQTEKKKKSGFAENLSIWLRGNLFIPDPRCFWIRPSARFLIKYLKQHPVDTIVSTGPPHSMHLIAKRINKKTQIPWLADFRDPWTDIDFYHKLMLTKWADRKHHKLQEQVFDNADILTTVGRTCVEFLEKAGAKSVKILHNGFDENDFTFLPVQVEPWFSISYFGSMNNDRNPRLLWKALSDLCGENQDFSNALKLRFYGTVDISLREYLEEFNLNDKTEFLGYVEHETVLRKSAESAVLLLIINNAPSVLGIVTGKIFEYMASGRPILCIAPKENDAAEIIEATKTGIRADFDEYFSLKRSISELYNNYKTMQHSASQQNINQYSRKNLTKQLVGFLNEISESEH